MDNKISEMIRASLDGVKEFTDVNSVVGGAINTPSGVTVIPVSRINIGFANGGVDFGKKALTGQNYGCGGGTGLSVTPLGFLVVNARGEVNLINMSGSADATADKIVSLIDRAPEIIDKIRNGLT